MSYIDSSSLLKTLWQEPESPVVREAIAAEPEVVISTLAELETEVQLRAKWLGGVYTKSHYEAYRKKLASFRETALSNFVIFLELSFAAPSNSILPGNGTADLSTGCMWPLWTTWVSAVC